MSLMKIEDCVSPLKYEEVSVGNAHLYLYEPGYFKLRHNNDVWMGHDTHNHWQCAEFLMELNLAYGRCITTGIGLGMIQTYLLRNPKVSEVIVYEKNQDVIDLFKIIANKNNLDISALKFVKNDADDMNGEDADCIFLDHWDSHIWEFLSERIRKIANNNNCKILWYWPAVLHYSRWCKKHQNLPINLKTYQDWVKYINVRNFPNELSEENLENIRMLEKKYAEDSVKHIMQEYKSYQERDVLRNKMLTKYKN